MPELIRYIRGKRLLTDKGFTSSENRKILAEAGLKSGLSYKASKGSPLSYSECLFNKIVAKRRFRIEQGLTKVQNLSLIFGARRVYHHYQLVDRFYSKRVAGVLYIECFVHHQSLSQF